MTVKTNGFTPVFDSLRGNPRYGLVGSSIFGAIWRYTQMNRRICDASLGNISYASGVSVRSCIRYISRLEEDGYIIDTTPKARNKPHRYTDTGKIEMDVEIFAMTQSHPAMTGSHGTMTQSHSQSDTESLEDTNKRQVKRQIKDAASAATPPPENPVNEFFPQKTETVIVNPPRSVAELKAGTEAALTRWAEGHETLTAEIRAITGREYSPRNRTQAAQLENLREWGATVETLKTCAAWVRERNAWKLDKDPSWRPTMNDLWENYRASQAAETAAKPKKSGIPMPEILND